MSNKIVKDKDLCSTKKEVEQSSIKSKAVSFYTKHKNLTILGVAGLILVGGAFLGVVGNNAYYTHLVNKESSSVGIDGDGYFFDPLLNYAIQFPQEWGYSTEDESIIKKAIEESKTNGLAFRLSQHKLPYEITPIVFAKDEGELGYRSFMSVSFRGFYGSELTEGKKFLEDEIVGILEGNGHTNVEFLINQLDNNGEVDRVIFDIKADSINEETGETVVTYYHQQSMIIGNNLCTVILGTTDEKLKRPNTVANLLLGIIETDPDYFYLKDDETDINNGNNNTLNEDGLKAEVVPNNTQKVYDDEHGHYHDVDEDGNVLKHYDTPENNSNKQSIPVDGGTIEIITGTDIDIDELKEKDGVNVNDVDLSNDENNLSND